MKKGKNWYKLAGNTAMLIPAYLAGGVGAALGGALGGAIAGPPGALVGAKLGGPAASAAVGFLGGYAVDWTRQGAKHVG